MITSILRWRLIWVEQINQIFFKISIQKIFFKLWKFLNQLILQKFIYYKIFCAFVLKWEINLRHNVKKIFWETKAHYDVHLLPSYCIVFSHFFYFLLCYTIYIISTYSKNKTNFRDIHLDKPLFKILNKKKNAYIFKIQFLLFINMFSYFVN